MEFKALFWEASIQMEIFLDSNVTEFQPNFWSPQEYELFGGSFQSPKVQTVLAMQKKRA